LLTLLAALDGAAQTWAPGPRLLFARWSAQALRLPDGAVLVIGGNLTTQLAEIWRPGTPGWVDGGFGGPRLVFCAAGLRDGGVVIMDNIDPAAYVGGDWVSITTAAIPREGSACTTLLDDSVLAAGGDLGGTPLVLIDTAERYLSAKGWRDAGQLPAPLTGALAVTLPNGHALIIGGQDNTSVLSAVTEYDPATETLQGRAPTIVGHVQHTATVLKDGRVLIVGGDPPNTCELYDPSTGPTLCPVPPAGKLANHAATLLADGRVLITGGSMQGAAQIFDPDAGVWVDAGQPFAPRVLHNSVLLSDGRVLVIGGQDPAFGISLITTELFDPGNRVAPDAGASSDGGVPDAGAPDSGVPDAGVADGGEPHAPPSSLALTCGCGTTDVPVTGLLVLLAMLALSKKGDRLLFCAASPARLFSHGCAKK
jgi:hypothetical protein